MTTKQAEDINSKFLRMKDSILNLKNSVQTQQVQHKVFVDKITDSLSKIHVDLRYSDGEKNWYKKEYYQMESDFMKEARQMKNNMTMVTIISATLAILLTIRSK